MSVCAVYTCVTDGYDNIYQPFSMVPNEQFICFSDDTEINLPYWNVRRLVSPTRLNIGHDINRFHKIFPHRMLSDYRYSIYMDGNISYENNFMILVEALRASGAALGVFRHPAGRTVREEVDACQRLHKFDHYDKLRAEAQLTEYKNLGFDVNQQVSANYLIVRDHSHPLLSDTMSLWWSQLFEFTKRDQVSLQFVLWRTGLPWVFLDDFPNVDPKDLVRAPHRRSFAQRVKKKLLQKFKSS